MIPSPSDLRMEEVALSARNRLGVTDDEQPDPIDLLRRLKYLGGIRDWRILSDLDMPKAEARWEASDKAILLRESLVRAVEAGDPDAAFTVFHEISHSLLGHQPRNRGPVEARLQFGRFTESDEADADWLARTLMAPEYLAKMDQTSDVHAFARRFGMPVSAATIRLEELKRRQRRHLGLRRKPPVADNVDPASARYIDTGDYDEAMTEMLRNARRWNDVGR